MIKKYHFYIYPWKNWSQLHMPQYIHVCNYTIPNIQAMEST